MNLVIKGKKEKYNLRFDRITQLCGMNIPLKTFIIDSICKHFSSEKYREYEENMIDNVEIDGDIPGRKQWECVRINSKESLVAALQVSKTGILGKCVKEGIGTFDCQNELIRIDAILVNVFDMLNKALLPAEMIQLTYDPEDLFGMIQKTTVKTSEGKDVHNLPIMDLIEVVLKVISKQQELIPEKRLYVFENIDHYVGREEYMTIVSRCETMCRESNLWFLFSTSLDEYVCMTDEYIESINVINESVFTMPSMEHVIRFIRDYYPLEKDWDEAVVKDILTRCMQKIGLSSELLQPSELVILKLINETNNIRMKWEKDPKSPEIQCLMTGKVL